MPPVQAPPSQQLPAVQKLRVRFAKRGRLRFTSHRDFQRAFERAVRRAELPVAFSHGFSPHPKISYAGAAPTGAASEAEYLEISLTQERDAEQVRVALDEALPPGLDVLEVVVAGPGALAERLEASEWRIALPGADPEAAAAAVGAFLGREEILVERMTKRGLRSFDCRAAVLRLTVVSEPGSVETCAILQVVLRHGTPAVRPDDVLAGVREVATLTVTGPALLTRLAQGPLTTDTGTVEDPLARDRDANQATATGQAGPRQTHTAEGDAAAPSVP
ncbi:TIGR03936 family radical SAM-associated protein [Kribbella sp.]|uniref:TIGR03936 family radical SAM-associated protein n=1 Tax=Kribbella sp. TaxID=1871183 RepID=UPI002D22169E|nr:TIGR03936 family radical SAM-associated protein [Kribbella sp.]HZX02708.1 TIGR03936 family radical SAM-associated protein [Kribbella sp.]